MRRTILGWGLALAATGLTAAAGALPRPAGQGGAQGALAPGSEAARRFETRVRPVLAEKCLVCHGASVQMGGVRFDTAAGARAAAARVPAALEHTGKVKMPPAGKLPDSERTALSDWARAGAPLPAATAAPKPDAWALRPVRNPAVPQVKARARVRNPIDAFVLAKLELKGLTFAPEADRRTLIRRVTVDLTGLPPTPAEVEAFVADKRPDAYERVVDRLLASPRYGEAWGRHWLDLVRYCDSLDARGSGGDGDIAFAWRYRDWVIDALNADMPYDRFLLEQVAGDLLPGPGGDLNVSGTIATGFLAIGNWGNGDADKDKILTDIADDQVDTIGKAFLGLTVGCARCHDHKFDPISTKDYYSLAGIFFSTHILPKLTPKGAGETPLRVPLETKAQRAAREALAKEQADLQIFLTQRRSEVAAAMAPEAGRYLKAIRDGREDGLPPWAVRRWKEALGLVGYPLMTVPVVSLAGNVGIDGLRGATDTPSQVVNTTGDTRQIATFTLPPHSVAVHPSPGNGVTAGWVSPISGSVAVGARVADADGACGNGIEWRVDLRTSRGTRTLARGAIDNGAQQTADDPQLRRLPVVPGDQVELVILPKGEYSCDTTVVELSVRAGDGRTWSLTADTLRAPGRNPAPDTFGNAAVWRYCDMAGASGGSLPEPVRAAWQTGDLEKAAAAFAAAKPDPTSPFAPDADADFPDAARAELRQRRARIAALREKAPAAIVYANAAQDGGVPESPHAGFHDVAVHVRGRYDRLGDIVPRGVPARFTGGAPIRVTAGSGRLELGRWLGDPKNPLTPRVMANRLWQHHFGFGIVRTPSNFGALGEKPTHPELLDWLASAFVRDGWSMKKMHRRMVTSTTYRQRSEAPSARAARVDPDNRLLWRMNRRRLTAEALRDSLLQAAGVLDTTAGGEALRDFTTPRRTVYCVSIRSDRTGFGPLFDMADSTNGVDRRTESLVAPQALYLMHNDFVQDQASRLAARLRAGAGSDRYRIDRAYRLLYSRPATAAEKAVGERFLAAARREGAPHPDARAWARYAHILLCANEFVFVD